MAKANLRRTKNCSASLGYNEIGCTPSVVSLFQCDTKLAFRLGEIAAQTELRQRQSTSAQLRRFHYAEKGSIGERIFVNYFIGSN
jgi:hypothetical protein